MADRKLFKGDMVYISEDNNVHKFTPSAFILSAALLGTSPTVTIGLSNSKSPSTL